MTKGKSLEDRSECPEGDKINTSAADDGQTIMDSAPARSDQSNSRRNSARSRMHEDFSTVPQKRQSSASPKRSVTTMVESPVCLNSHHNGRITGMTHVSKFFMRNLCVLSFYNLHVSKFL